MPAMIQRDPIARSRARLFGLANRLWAENPAAKSEELHMLVGGITGKESIKELSTAEFAEVNKELEARLAARGIPAYSKAKAATKSKNIPGKASEKEKGKMWRLIYLIIECDENPNMTTAGTRMCGAVKEF